MAFTLRLQIVRKRFDSSIVFLFSGYFYKIVKFKLIHKINGLIAQPLIGSMDKIGQSNKIRNIHQKILLRYKNVFNYA